MGLFITFEGGEGSGKTTQAGKLHKKLAKLGIPTILTQEPGGTWLGFMLRAIVKRMVLAPSLSPVVELLLFCASRAQLISKVIEPSLRQSLVVICDRYAESTFAYQGYGRGLGLEMIRVVNSIATGGLRPDLIILLDIDSASGLARQQAKRSLFHRLRNIKDRFGNSNIDFHQRVRRGYLEMAAAEPERWFVVDASLPKNEIEKLIWEKVKGLIATTEKQFTTIEYSSEPEA